MALALPFVLALLVSAALVPIVRVVALRLGYVAPPDQPRGISRRKAQFGGVAIVLAVLACGAATGAFESTPVLLISSMALFVVGLVSDLFAVKPVAKIVVLIVIASAFLFFDLRLYWTESLVLDSIVTIFWIVGVTSAFNLLDNMDGLCGGIALIAGTAFLFTVAPIPAEGPRLLQTQYLAILLGAVAGFLPYNIHPASAAMGDSGSLVVGLNMAAMTLQIAPGRGSDLVSILLVPALLLLIPLVDATVVAMSRLLSPQPDGTPSGYSSHRLVAIGLSERAAVGLLWALAAVSGVIAIAADRREGLSGLVAAMFVIAIALCTVYLARVKVHEGKDANRASGAITPLGAGLGYRRRLAEVLLDLVLVSVAYYGAYRLRFDSEGWAENFPYFLESFPVVLGTQMVALFAVGAYRGMWRYFSLNDGVTFAKSVFVGAVTSQLAILYLYGFEGHPAATAIVYGMLLLILLVGSRASFRLLSEFLQRQRRTGRRLLIYGAGDAGVNAVRHLLNEARNDYRLVGYIDDDPQLRNARVHGYPVIGGYDHLVGKIMAGEIDAVAVTHDREETQGLAWLCAQHGVTLHRLAVDWREVRTAETVAAGGWAEGRIVPFMGARGSSIAGSPLRREGTLRETASSTAGPEAAPAAVAEAPIKVLHIITRLILGGAQENTIYTAIGQHRDPRFDVTILCGIDEAGEGDMFGEVARAGVRTVVLPSLLREIRPWTDLKAVVDIYRFLRKGKYAIVHTHSSKAGIIGRIAAKAAGAPIIVHTLHGLVFHEFQSAWRNRLFVALKRICAPMTDKIISVSDRVSEAALSRGVGRPDQHITIYSGIELDLFLSVRDRLTVEEAKRRAGLPADAPVVGKIARMFPLKGHEQFLEVAVRIACHRPDAWFLLVGDGPLRQQLRKEADRLGIGERLVMVGRVPPERVPDYIQAMDVVVHTSLREGIARVLPQAGAVGKPVVTFQLDGAPEVVRDGVSGYLLPPLDRDGVANRAVELLRDPDRRHAMGDAGRAFAAKHFSVERMVERINSVYLELLAQRAELATASTVRRPPI